MFYLFPCYVTYVSIYQSSNVNFPLKTENLKVMLKKVLQNMFKIQFWKYKREIFICKIDKEKLSEHRFKTYKTYNL